MRPRWSFSGVVWALAALALALRVYRIDAEGFWLDEAFTVINASVTMRGIPFALAEQSVHPPLYFLLVHPWIAAFGATEWAVRATSAIAGAAAVPLMAVYGRAVADARTGIVAAALLATSPYHLLQSQNARPYALLATLLLASLLAYHRLLEAPDRRRGAVYVLTGAALAYTHLFGLLTLLGHALHFVLFRGIDGRIARLGPGRFLALHVAIAALFAPWVPALLSQVSRREEAWAWIPPPNLHTLTGALSEYAIGSTSYALLLVGLGAAGAIVTARRREGWGERASAILLFIAVPVVIPLLVSKLYHPIFVARYAIQALLGLYLLGAIAIARMAQPAWVAALGAAAVIGAAAPRLRAVYFEPQNDDWRGVARFLDAHVEGEAELVVFYPEFAQKPVDLYRRRALSEAGIPLSFARPSYTFDPAQLASARNLLAPSSRVWLVVWRGAGDAASLGAIFGDGWSMRGSDAFAGATVARFERSDP